MFPLQDFLGYMALKKSFADMKKKNDEIQALKPKEPYLGTLKEVRPELIKLAPPVNDLYKPPRVLQPPPSLIHIKPVPRPKEDRYVCRIGCVKKIRMK